MINDFLKFIKDSKTPVANVLLVKELLNKNGYKELKEIENWNFENNSKYYVVRNDSSIIAFNISKNIKGFNIVASHNDSPCFKLKNNFDLVTCSYNRLDTEVYGGPILSTWFDRPLGVSGRLFIKSGNNVREEYISYDDICIIPNLAIHFTRGTDAGNINLANDTYPICSSDGTSLKEYIEKNILKENETILSHDLFLYNCEEPKLVGIDKSMVSASRIDNIECAYTSINALINSNNENMVNVCCIFNNEEVGSGANNAAESTFLLDVMNRICNSFNVDKYPVFANSFLVSADNAHAVHPAHPNKTDMLNPVYLNKGVVIKSSSSLTYTTDAYSKAVFCNILENNNIPYQHFCNASDVRGGSTLGRILLDKVSIPSVDIGLGQLAMHSAYETAGVKDLEYMEKALLCFYDNRD